MVRHSDATRTTWTQVNVGTAVDLYSIRRPASTQVWVSGLNGVVREDNAGTDWLSRDMQTSDRIVMYSRESGCQNALGSSGSLHQTCNHGVDWATLDSGKLLSLNHGAGFTTSTSWIVGDVGTILFSNDGGDSWTSQESGTTEDLHYIIEAGGGFKIVVGNAGTILRSVDGVAWTKVDLKVNEDLWNVSSSGQNGGWLLAVGEKGTVLRSTNTGATWYRLDPETQVDLYAGTMVSNSEYIVGGVGGVLMRTTNSGGECVTPVPVEPTSWGALRSRY